MDIKKVVEDLWKRNLEKGILCVVKLAMIRMALFQFFKISVNIKGATL